MRNQSCLAAFCALVIATQVGLAHAEDLGVIGKTYDIAERDLIEAMKDKLRQMEKTGELAKKQDEYKNRVMSGIEHPKPIPEIGITTPPLSRTRILLTHPAKSFIRVAHASIRSITSAGTNTCCSWTGETRNSWI